MTRTDVHRPSEIVPTDYEWVCFDYLGASDLGALMGLTAERENFRRHQARTGGGYSHHEHGGTCGICGANALYVSRFHHRPSNEYLVVGWECAAKLEMAQDDGAANRFRTAILDAREAQAGKRKAQATLADLGLTAAWDLYLAPAPDNGGWPKEESILVDMVRRLVQYGSLSEKQVAFARKLLTESIPQRAAKLAARAIAQAASPSWEPGRAQVRGTILSLKIVDTDFGSTLKGLLKLDTDERKLWLTIPAGAGGAKVGDTLIVRATVQPSKDDRLFAFGSRPTLLVHTPKETTT